MSSPASPTGGASRRLPGRTRLKLAAALALGLVVVWLVPNIGTPDGAPPVGLLLGAGVAVGAVVVGTLYFVLARDLNLPSAVIAYALGFNAVIALVKFTFAAEGIYEVNREVNFTGFINISDPFGAIAAGVLVLLLYGLVYWAIYRIFRSRLIPRAAGAGRRAMALTGKTVLTLVGGAVLLAMGGGGFVLLFPLIAVGSGYEYLSFVFTSAASLLIALALAGATVLAALAFKETADRAALIGDTALFVSFFWVGLAFLALYHVLWVVYILVLTSIWPLKVVVPK